MTDNTLYQNLTSITQSLLEKKSLNNVFDAITKTACSFFNASASSIMLFDKEREYLTITRSYNLSEQYLRVVKVGKDQEIAGKVCQEKNHDLSVTLLVFLKKSMINSRSIGHRKKGWFHW